MDDLRRIDLNLLLTLHALLSEQHVSRAALRLHRSQPAVSHALAQLRELFADPLLVRRDGRLQLTARAEALQAPLQEALQQLDGLLGTPGFEPARARRTFRLAMSDYGARVVLPALMRLMRREAPGIDLVVSQGSREAMLGQLIDGEADLALGVFPELPTEMAQQVLFEESFVCLADRASLPPRGGLALEPWLARPHVLVAVRPGIDNEIDQALASLGARRRIALTLPHWGGPKVSLPGPTWCSPLPGAALPVPGWTRRCAGSRRPWRSHRSPLPRPGTRGVTAMPGTAGCGRGSRRCA